MRILFKYLILALLFLSHSALNGQEIKIIDIKDESPLGFVLLSQENRTQYAMTNDNGIAEVSNLDKSVPVIFYLLGYQKDTLPWASIQEKGFTISLQESSLELDPIVISTARWRQSNRNNPQKISNISFNDIELKNPQTSADLLGKFW